MTGWKRGNAWKAAGFLAALAGFLAVTTLVPMMRPEPTVEGPQVEVPAMTNVPPADETLRVDLE